ncbi:MAG TPA: SLC13 family permease [Anaerolineaceae bacterium]|nr:SLC13 family permease [Anaerolineaceae bacterium]
MNIEIIAVLIILSITILMLIFEIIRIDIVAILCMLVLGWTGILTPNEMLSGFSSNAVFVMMAVMIMGRGIKKTGIMDDFSRLVLEKVGNQKSKIIGFLSLTIGVLSGLIQNIGAIALFLPGILNISRRSKISPSELILPIGFSAILGGTLTMVGSGPLILINDLLNNANLESYKIFSVTPIGLLLLLVGIGYFFLFGKYVLPQKENEQQTETDQEKLIKTLHLPHNIWHYAIRPDSPLIGKTTEASGIWQKTGVNVLGLSRGKKIDYAPWRETLFEAGQELALLGSQEETKEFAEKNKLELNADSTHFAKLRDPERSGFAEVIVPHHSELVGKTIREFSLRKRYAVEPVLLFSKGEEIKGDISDHEIFPGDTIIVYGIWERISEIKASNNFVVVTPFEKKDKVQSKTGIAITCFLLAIGLSLYGFPISLAFFSGAIAMVLFGVLSIQEMYQSIEWKVVFLLVGLIPLGFAMQKTGTAIFLAENLMSLVLGKHTILIIFMIGLLATVFSLFMSNVGAIVVLAPLVIEMAQIGELDPRPLALMAAVCVANSFIFPTHQVNALIMSPGGYRNADFFKAGIGLTLLFLVVVVLYFYFFMM